MSLRGWLSGKAEQLTASSQDLTQSGLQRDVEEAMLAANHIFDDDLEAAEEGLKKGSSSFHKLGRGLTAFIKATLGFEQDAMKDAAEWLAAAEVSALGDQKRVVKEPEAFHSRVYNQGAEYALVTAQAQLMAAVVGVLNESLTESLKGFYKARKAYLVLESIIASETKFMKTVGLTPASNLSTSRIEVRTPDDSESDDEVFMDAEESLLDLSADDKTHKYIEHNGYSAASSVISAPYITKSGHATNGSVDKEMTDSNLSHLETQLPSLSNLDEHFHPIDVFVHSGANMCFGMLLLVLSMIPPTFAKLLWIVGFQGDRERGLRLLWNASQFNNINGATAALVILAYYDTFVGFCDILPPDELSDGTESSQGVDPSYPATRLKSLLSGMRQRYPQSRLWIIEQARMYAIHRDLDSGVQLLIDTPASPLKQVKALALFERSIQTLCAHRYALCAESLLEWRKNSNWSPSICYYIAACTQIQMCRDAQDAGNDDEAAQYAEKATEFLAQSKKHTGKKKFLARQLPFEAFVVRKMAKWEAHMQTHDVSLIDAIGIGPGEEFTYHSGGFRKMNSTQRAKSLANLRQSAERLQRREWRDECADEFSAVALMQAAVHRASGDHAEATRLLQDEVLGKEVAQFKGELKEDYLLPVAHYEMASNLWAQRERRIQGGGAGASAADAERIRQAQTYLEKAAKAESYDLEARMGMRITMGLNTTRAWLATYNG